MKRQTLAPIVLVLLILASLACASQVTKEELQIDEPVVFKSLDEVYYAWKAFVEPGSEYTFSVRSVEYGEEGYYGFIHILDEGTNYYDYQAEDVIAEGEHFTPYVSFIAPEDGTITIMITMINWVNTDIEVTLTQTAKN